MPKYRLTQATAKLGVNYVKRIIKSQRHDFIEIHQQDDIGLDCLIQLRENGLTNRIISMQVKSGKSFYNSGIQTCKIPIESHREYWNNKEFPVLGVVFVPELYKAFWCDIKKELKRDENIKQISFPATAENEFNHYTFMSYVKDLGFPSYFYVARIHEFSRSNKTIKTFLNSISVHISEIVPNLKCFHNLSQFFTDIGWEFINEEQTVDTKNNCKFTTNHFALNQGKMTYSKACKLIYYDSNFEFFFDEKLKELSKVLSKYD